MAEQEFHHALPVGAELSGYRIDAILGAHAYAITYRATETAHGRTVAIKEYLPTGLAMRQSDGVSIGPISSAHAQNFDWGLKSFQEEAQILYDLSHSNIVPVLGCFRENNTAYLVMKFQEGERLSARLTAGPLSQQEIDHLLPPVLDALESVHAAGLQHLDLRPDKILTRQDGTPVLLDFGRANQMLAQRTDNAGAVAADGYAPHEQYESGENLGPWSDIYALGAVLYHCMTGQKPVTATARAFAAFRGEQDPLQTQARPTSGDYRPALFAAVEQALQIPEKSRPQTVAAFRALLADSDASAAAATPEAGSTAATASLAATYAAEPDARTKRAEPSETALVPMTPAEGATPAIAGPTDSPPALPPPTDAGSPWRRPPVLIGSGVIALLLLGGVGFATLSGGEGPTDPPNESTSGAGTTRAKDGNNTSPAQDAEKIMKASKQADEEAARREAEARRAARARRKKKAAAPRLAVLFANRRLQTYMPGRPRLTLLRFSAGGGLTAVTEKPPLQTGYINESGTWSVRGKTLCIRLSEWNRGTTACFTVAYTGNPKAARVRVSAFGAAGRLSGTLTY